MRKEIYFFLVCAKQIVVLDDEFIFYEKIIKLEPKIHKAQRRRMRTRVNLKQRFHQFKVGKQISR